MKNAIFLNLEKICLVEDGFDFSLSVSFPFPSYLHTHTNTHNVKFNFFFSLSGDEERDGGGETELETETEGEGMMTYARPFRLPTRCVWMWLRGCECLFLWCVGLFYV